MVSIDNPIAVIGYGRSGKGAAKALATRGYEVHVYDQKDIHEDLLPDNVTLHVYEDAHALADAVCSQGVSLVVVSPGIAPHSPIFERSRALGIPLWGEVELAWQLQENGPHAGRPWLTVTGTNGKTTTVGMLGSMLRAGGENACEVGNIGVPITLAIDSDASVFAVELSSFQLETTHALSPKASVCLNVDADHLDWHGSREAYANAKAKVYHNTQVACVYPVSSQEVESMVANADVIEGARAIGITLDIPAVSQLGIVDDALVDRAFCDNRMEEALFLASFKDLEHLTGPHISPAIIADALAACALARAYGIAPEAIAQGLRDYVPASHRRHVIGEIADMVWIDDSKATNAHAAAASLNGINRGTAIWIAGGDPKGQKFDDLVSQVAPILRGVVLIGADRSEFRKAFAVHAPQIPVIEVEAHDDWMFSVVNEAVGLSRPGDTVVLAPATASWDQFDNYGQRGDIFTEAVLRLKEMWGKRP